MTGWMITAFVIGIALGWYARPGAEPAEKQEDNSSITIKRTRQSMRQPGKTVTTYDQYKTQKGLYAPVRPGKGNTADEKEIT